MAHTNTHDNSILMIIMSFILQGGIWLNDWASNITLDGIYLFLYNSAKLGALAASIWASYRVATKNK